MNHNAVADAIMNAVVAGVILVLVYWTCIMPDETASASDVDCVELGENQGQ